MTFKKPLVLGSSFSLECSQVEGNGSHRKPQQWFSPFLCLELLIKTVWREQCVTGKHSTSNPGVWNAMHRTFSIIFLTAWFHFLTRNVVLGEKTLNCEIKWNDNLKGKPGAIHHISFENSISCYLLVTTWENISFCGLIGRTCPALTWHWKEGREIWLSHLNFTLPQWTEVSNNVPSFWPSTPHHYPPFAFKISLLSG
jgi:hypothetical protein